MLPRRLAAPFRRPIPASAKKRHSLCSGASTKRSRPQCAPRRPPDGCPTTSTTPP